MAHFAGQSPGSCDDLLLIDSTPVECGRSRETAKRSALAEVAGYGYCAAHSRWFWGMRLHALCAPDGTPRALELAHPSRDEREVALVLLERTKREAVACLVCDKGYAGRDFADDAAQLRVLVVRPARQTSLLAGRTWRPSASASSRSSGPPRTSSRWSAMEPARSPVCASVSFRGSSAWRLASVSTTGWEGPAEHSSTTAPEVWAWNQSSRRSRLMLGILSRPMGSPVLSCEP